MGVRIASKEDIIGTHTPSTLNTEETVIEIQGETDDYIIEGYIDLGNLNDGDEVIITEYISVDGENYRVYERQVFSNKQEKPVLRFHSKLFYKSMKYKITINQTKGTIRSFPYAFIKQVLEVV